MAHHQYLNEQSQNLRAVGSSDYEASSRDFIADSVGRATEGIEDTFAEKGEKHQWQRSRDEEETRIMEDTQSQDVTVVPENWKQCLPFLESHLVILRLLDEMGIPSPVDMKKTLADPGNLRSRVEELKCLLRALMGVRYGDPDSDEARAAVQTFMDDIRSEQLLDPLGADEPSDTTVGSIARFNAKIYKTLESNQDIRLINLYPAGRTTDPLECDLMTASFEEAPVYEALSYTWGLQSNAVETLLVINAARGPVQITTNLDAALRKLRLVDRKRALWVDAVCIDQSNNEEKAHQIAQMRRVYSEAKLVCIWLGKGSNTTPEALKFIRSMPEIFGRLTVNHDLHLYSPADVTPLDELLESPWWKRVWTFQEIVSAREARIYIGDEIIAWSEISKAFWACCEFSLAWSTDSSITREDSFEKALPHMTHLAIIEQHREQDLLPTFLETLINHGSRKATDPRDNIFGLLGVVDTADPCHSNPLLQPDYSIKLSDLLTRVTRHLVKHHGIDVIAFAILGLREAVELNHYVAYLPSWAVDWRNLWRQTGVMFAFTNLSRALDPGVRMVKMFVEAFERGQRTELKKQFEEGTASSSSDRDEPETELLFAIDEPRRPLELKSSKELVSVRFSLFCASHGLVTGPNRYLTWYKGQKADFVNLISSGFTLDTIEVLGSVKTGVKTAHDRASEAIVRFAGRLSREWCPSLPYKYVPSQSMEEALFRCMTADQWPREYDPNHGYDRLNEQSPWREGSTGGTTALERFEGKVNHKILLERISLHRRLFRSRSGYIGLAPPLAEEGDPIVILGGATVPLVLHWQNHGQHYNLIGDW